MLNAAVYCRAVIFFCFLLFVIPTDMLSRVYNACNVVRVYSYMYCTSIRYLDVIYVGTEYIYMVTPYDG